MDEDKTNAVEEDTKGHIRMNVPMFGTTPGQVIQPGQPNYECFKKWAQDKARKFGREICSFVGTVKEKVEGTEEKVTDTVKAVEEKEPDGSKGVVNTFAKGK